MHLRTGSGKIVRMQSTPTRVQILRSKKALAHTLAIPITVWRTIKDVWRYGYDARGIWRDRGPLCTEARLRWGRFADEIARKYPWLHFRRLTGPLEPIKPNWSTYSPSRRAVPLPTFVRTKGGPEAPVPDNAYRGWQVKH